MRNWTRNLLVVAAVLGCALPAAAGATTQPAAVAPTTRPVKAAVIHIRGDIDELANRFLASRLNMARAAGAEVVIIDLDTYGGLVHSALEMSRLLKTQPGLRTIALVNHKAYSAGSMLAMACDEIYMVPQAVLGNCAPIKVAEDGRVQTMGDEERGKARSPIVIDFEDSALRTGRDPILGRAMVVMDTVVRWLEDPATGHRRFVEGPEADRLLATGQWRVVQDAAVADPIDAGDTLLTVKTAKAVAMGLAQEVAGLDALAEQRGWTLLPAYRQDLWEDLLTVLGTPLARAVLIGLFLLCVYIAAHAPGNGLAELVGLLALVLALGVPLLTGYAQWWEIGVILVGIVLLAVELFVLPGFGFAGIAGLVLILGGMLLTFVAPEPGSSGPRLPTLGATWQSLQTGLLAMTGATVVTLVVAAIIRPLLPRLPLLRHLMLTTAVGTTPTAQAGTLTHIEPSELQPGLGARGRALTDLKPGGTVEFRDAAGAVQVVSVVGKGYIPAGTTVVVTDLDGPTVHVQQERA
jgi:membrane-bound serine protease (ClpP class)